MAVFDPTQQCLTKNRFGRINNTGGIQFRYSIERNSITSSHSYQAQSYSCNVWAEIPLQVTIAEGVTRRCVPNDFIRLMLGWTEVQSNILHRWTPELMPQLSEDTSTFYYCQSCNLVSVAGTPKEPDGEYLLPAGDGTHPIRDVDEEPPLPEEQRPIRLMVAGEYPYSIENYWPRARYYKFQCTFSTLPYTLKDNEFHTDVWSVVGGRNESTRYCIVDKKPHEENERSVAGEFYLVPDNGDPSPLNEVPGTRSGISRITVDWLQLPQVPPTDNIKACYGKSNEHAFFGYPAEKVILVTHEYTRSTDLHGNPMYTVRYVFAAREDERTWNQFRLPNKTPPNHLATVKRVIDASKKVFGDVPFPKTDYSKLFKLV